MNFAMKPKLHLPISARDHVQGPDTAPVTVLEYGDYGSLACAHAHSAIRALRRRFGDQLRIVFRHFPFSALRIDAQHAAQASEAAALQDCFWEMHDLLFQHQDRLSDRHLRCYAGQLGLEMTRFSREMAAQTHVVRVREDFLSGVRSGVTQSPAFFVNGTQHLGPLELGSLSAAIDRAACVNNSMGNLAPGLRKPDPSRPISSNSPYSFQYSPGLTAASSERKRYCKH